MEGKMILKDSPEAAQLKTVTGWVSANGRFWGDDENIARFAGCTHVRCSECGAPVEKTWLKCETCRHKAANEKFNALLVVEWDRVTPLCLFDSDTYFFGEEDLFDFCDTNEVLPEDLKIVLCEPNYYHPIRSDMWEDVLPEDGEIPIALQLRLDELNKFISTLSPASWSEGKKRVVIPNSEYQQWLGV